MIHTAQRVRPGRRLERDCAQVDARAAAPLAAGDESDCLKFEFEIQIFKKLCFDFDNNFDWT